MLAGGNAAVVVASESHPRAAIELAEVLATSDVPGGVVNILTGRRAELAPHLASHLDVDALDLDAGDAELERAAADNVKRVVRDRGDAQSPYEISAFLELKTVWHPWGGSGPVRDNRRAMTHVDHRQAASSPLGMPGAFLRGCVLAWRRRRTPSRADRHGPDPRRAACSSPSSCSGSTCARSSRACRRCWTGSARTSG